MATVRIPSLMRDLTAGASTVEVKGVGTVREVLTKLEERYPGIRARLIEDGRLAEHISVMVDAVEARSLTARVEEDSEVTIIPAISGGSHSNR